MSVRGAYLYQFLELVRERGVDHGSMIAGLPIDDTSLADPATRVPLSICEAVLGRALAATRDHALPIQLAMRTHAASHGFLGFAAMTAKTAREALELAARYTTTHSSAIQLTLYIDGHMAALVVQEHRPLPALVREFLVVGLLVGIASLTEHLTGDPVEWTLECAFAARPYGPAMPATIETRFEAPGHRLVFPSAVLDRRLRTADPVAFRLAVDQCERQLAESGHTGFVGRVREQMTRSAGDMPLDDIAQALRMSPRTLKRKLADTGTTFSALRDEVLCQRSFLLLQNRELSVGQVAAMLGYSDVASFTRAFRKWTGRTPHAYRMRMVEP